MRPSCRCASGSTCIRRTPGRPSYLNGSSASRTEAGATSCGSEPIWLSVTRASAASVSCCSRGSTAASASSAAAVTVSGASARASVCFGARNNACNCSSIALKSCGGGSAARASCASRNIPEACSACLRPAGVARVCASGRRSRNCRMSAANGAGKAPGVRASPASVLSSGSNSPWRGSNSRSARWMAVSAAAGATTRSTTGLPVLVTCRVSTWPVLTGSSLRASRMALPRRSVSTPSGERASTVTCRICPTAQECVSAVAAVGVRVGPAPPIGKVVMRLCRQGYSGFAGCRRICAWIVRVSPAQSIVSSMIVMCTLDCFSDNSCQT